MKNASKCNVRFAMYTLHCDIYSFKECLSQHKSIGKSWLQFSSFTAIVECSVLKYRAAMPSSRFYILALHCNIDLKRAILALTIILAKKLKTILPYNQLLCKLVLFICLSKQCVLLPFFTCLRYMYINSCNLQKLIH